MPYGIPDPTWIRLPPDDQAAIIAASKGQPPPAIGGYAPTRASPLPTTIAPTVAPPTQATPAPPPNLTAGSGAANAIPSNVNGPDDVLVPKGMAPAARPGVTLIPATLVAPPIGASTNPTQPTPATPPPPLDLSGDALVPKGMAPAARPGVTLIPATLVAPPIGASTNPTPPTLTTPTPPQRPLADWHPIVTLPPIPSLEHLAGDAAVAVVQEIASRLGLHATKAEIALSLQPGNIGRAVPSLVLAASLFDLEKLAAAKPYNHWGPQYDLTNGAPDAFLHAAYAGILTLRYGEDYARALTKAHETGTPQNNLLQKNARTMDLHNNEVGIKLALVIKASPPPPPSALSIPTYGVANNGSEAELLALLFQASEPMAGLTSGLVTLGPPGSSEPQVKRDPRIYSLDTGRPTRIAFPGNP